MKNNNYICHAPYFRNSIAYDHDFWYTCVKWYHIISYCIIRYHISRCFFHFFKILIFWIVNGIKGQKMAQNDKKFCLSCFISQELYIIWIFIYGTVVWNDTISRCFLNFFKILIFQVVREVKGQKIVQNDKKLCL